MGRRETVALLLISILIIMVGPWPVLLANEPDPSLAKGVIINELLPAPRPGGSETEYIALHNADPQDADISQWSLCGKGDCIILDNGSSLGPEATIFIAQNEDIFRSMKGISPWAQWSGQWPQFANDGDFLQLIDRDGKIVDAVTLGAPYQGDGWLGEAGPAPRLGHVHVRNNLLIEGSRTFIDTDGAADWPLNKVRRAEYVWFGPRTFKSVSQVTGLVLPEDGGTIVDTLLDARSQILINTYEFRSLAMMGHLSSILRKGVMVKLLLEMRPVGGMKDVEVSIIHGLLDQGCQIRLAGSNISGGYPGAFGYDHAKYMVIDSDRTLVISENLVDAALIPNSSGNRGWGAIVKDKDLADYHRDLFELDYRSALDPHKVLGDRLDRAPKISDGGRSQDLLPKGPNEDLIFDGTTYLTPLISPDYSEGTLLSIISNAEYRLYIEMLSFELGWEYIGLKETSPLLDAILNAARRGVEVKVLLDPNFLSSSENDEVMAYLNEVASREGLDLEARMANILNISLLHNKGLIVDDMVIVSSINWGDSALRDNRELGLAIEAPGMADRYITVYFEDWESDGTDPINIDTAPILEGSTPEERSLYPICGTVLGMGAVLVLILVVRQWTVKDGKG